MRSRTGCLTCRRRKLKCDERKPICGQCQKASRECVPSSGIVFRHQHNASMNGDDFDSENNLKGFYAYKDTFNSDTIWVDIPKHITFLNTTNPYTDPLLSDSETSSTASNSPRSEPTTAPSWTTSSGSQSLPDTTPGATNEPFPPFIPEDLSLRIPLPPPLDQDPILFPSPISTSLPTSFIATNPCSVRPTPSISAPPIPSGSFAPLESSTNPPSRPTRPKRPFQSRADTSYDSKSDQEVAFLLRHFSEGPGRWLDLFDLGSYFASYVPLKAVDNAVLRYAAVAYSAKSLSRKQKKRTSSVYGKVGTDTALDLPAVDWYRKATEYYDKAVSLLLEALKDRNAVTTGPAIEAPRATSAENSQGVPARKRRRTNSMTASSYTDEILAAIAILGLYEFLDGSIPEWVKHINGAKSVLGALQEQVQTQLIIENASLLDANLCFASKAQQAIFWNIARQDMLAAYINNSHTRIDTEDYALWRGAGLPIDDAGQIFSNNPNDLLQPETEITIKEDTVCITLIWLMAKVMNFLSSGCDPPLQQSRLDTWLHLQLQFQTWYTNLPPAFQPSSRHEPMMPSAAINASIDPTLFPEIWYSIPISASTMQSYHMSQVLLLLNKPPEPTSTAVSPDISSYTTSVAHAREIISISLSRVDESVLIHSIQPLFTAGRCLRDHRERQAVLQLLQFVEEEVGWATGYRVRELMDGWRRQDVGVNSAMAVPCSDLVGSLSLEEMAQVEALGLGF